MLITHKNKTRNDNKTIIKQIGANMRSKELAKVISQECIGTGVYSMWIETKAADTAVADSLFQFTVMTKLNYCLDLLVFVR